MLLVGYCCYLLLRQSSSLPLYRLDCVTIGCMTISLDMIDLNVRNKAFYYKFKSRSQPSIRRWAASGHATRHSIILQSTNCTEMSGVAVFCMCHRFETCKYIKYKTTKQSMTRRTNNGHNEHSGSVKLQPHNRL